MNIDNAARDIMLEFFREHAPRAPVSECLNYANGLQRLRQSEYDLKCTLAVLSNILCDTNGKIKDHIAKEIEHTPALKKAVEIVQNHQAWVVCGPGRGMEALLEEFTP